MDSKYLKSSGSDRALGLRRDRPRPMSYDDLKQFVKGESKNFSFIKGVNRLSINTYSTSTPSAAIRTNQFILPFSVKSSVRADTEGDEKKKFNAREVIRKKMQYFESVSKPRQKVDPREAVKDIYDLSGEKLNDLISISELSKASQIVAKQGIDQLSFCYVRQLKQFCKEVMRNLES